MNIAKDIDLSGYKLRQTGNRQQKLTIDGVVISVRPELLLQVEHRKKPQSAGAIKLYFSKGKPLVDGAEKYVGAVLYKFVREYVPPQDTANRPDCMLIDVFAEKIHVAPGATKKRFKELTDGCVEIAALWKTIQEPIERAKYWVGKRKPTEKAREGASKKK